jgi:hypothetical protein
MADNTSQGGMRMWPSPEVAAWLYDWANIGLIIGLVLGAVSTVLIVWMGNVKEEYLNLELSRSRERTASLEKQSDESRTAIAKANADAAASLAAAKQAEANLAGANSRAEEAKAVSAEANARAAEANKTAEGERLARVKIEEKLAPRSITPEQIAGLSRRLKPYAGIPIDILQIGESPEITHFRSLIEMPLRAAGLRPVSSTAVGSGSFIGLSVGVLIDANDSEKLAATALLSALNAEGIIARNGGIVKREDWPGFVMAATGETANKAPIRINVGSKP